jgi:beta-lactamase class C
MRTLALAIVATVMAGSSFASGAAAQESVRRIIQDEILALLPADGAGGIAVAVRVDGRLLFFEAGFADRSGQRPIKPDSLFNIASLRKPFETTLLALAVRRGRMALDDPVIRYVPELSKGGDIRRVTVGQLATHTSGLLLPQDHPPWPTTRYTLTGFLETLNRWKADAAHQPGRQHIYTHAGFILLQLALERGLDASVRDLAKREIFEPLGMSASDIPGRGKDGASDIPPPLLRRAVQGYSEDGVAIGGRGDQQTYYDWPGTGQMYSSARDLAAFLDANLGVRRIAPTLLQAMAAARAPAVPTGPHSAQALAWEIDDSAGPTVVDKYGGLNNASAYMGMMPARGLGIVILSNRGGIDVVPAGRRALRLISQHGMCAAQWSSMRASS